MRKTKLLAIAMAAVVGMSSVPADLSRCSSSTGG